MTEEKRQSSVDIAFIILKKSKKPMSAQELISIGIQEYGLEMKGKTPAATLDANFCNERKRRAKKDREQRFVRVRRGIWGLQEYLGTHYQISEGVKQPEEPK